MGLFSLDPEFVDTKCTLTLDTPLSSNALLLTTLEGKEAISRPFEVRLGMVSEDIDIDPDDLIGKEISVKVKAPPADSALGALFSKTTSRYFHGIVKEFSSGVAVGDDKGFRAYYATLVPNLWRLSQRTNCRIFQEKTVVDIIETVLEDNKLKKYSDFTTSGISGKLSKHKWDYCVQYRESDLDFISRLMEQLGIYYYFDHDSSSHKMVIADKDPLNWDTVDLTYKPFRDLEDEDDQLTSWQHVHSLEPGKVSITDFDYRNTAKDLSATVTSTGSSLAKMMEVYDYPGYYQTTKKDAFATSSEGKLLAETHLESLETARHLVRGSSNSRQLVAGCRIQVDMEHKPLSDDDGDKFLLTSIQHSYRQVIIPVGGHVGALKYSNQFVGIPVKQTFRPPRVTPKPVVEGPQTAIVIGAKAFTAQNKSDQEVMTDKYGRVKVQFPWDRRDGKGEKKFENSSCWIRVSHGHAGAGWGMISIPRKGEEVIVDFLEGDPDRPIITGRVYNAQNPVPYKLDDKKEKDNIYISGYKSRSSLKGEVTANYNELRFQDKKGKEHVYFHAERDFTRVVENKDIQVVSDKKEISEKRLDKIAKATKDGSQTIEIYKNRTLTVLTGDEKFNVDEGDRTVTIKKGNDHHEVEEGKRTAKIAKGNDEIEVSKGDRIVEVKKGQHKLDVAKDITMNSDKNIKITAKSDTISLKVGRSSITLKKNGNIDIKGQKITLNGTTIKLKANRNIDLSANQAIAAKSKFKVDVSGVKTKVEGKVALMLAGLKVDTKANLMATQAGNLMAQLKGGAITKVKGAITFVG